MHTDLPDYIDPEAFDGFVTMRKAKGTRAPWTARAQTLLLNKLAEFHKQGWCTTSLLDEATIRGWSSCFLYAECPRRSIQAERTKTDLDTATLRKPDQSAEVRARVGALTQRLRRVA